MAGHLPEGTPSVDTNNGSRLATLPPSGRASDAVAVLRPKKAKLRKRLPTCSQSTPRRKPLSDRTDLNIKRLKDVTPFLTLLFGVVLTPIVVGIYSVNERAKAYAQEQNRIRNENIQLESKLYEQAVAEKTRYGAIIALATIDLTRALNYANHYAADGQATAAAMAILAEHESSGAGGRGIDPARYLRRSLDYQMQEYREIDLHVMSIGQKFETLTHTPGIKEQLLAFSQFLRERPPLRKIVSALPYPSEGLKADNPLVKWLPEKVAGFATNLDDPWTLVDNGKKLMQTLDEFPDLYKRYYATTLEEERVNLAAVEKLLDDGQPKLEVVVRLIEIFGRTNARIEEAKKDWGRLRNSFEKFNALARMQLDKPGVGPKLEDLQAAFDELTFNLESCRARRIDALYLNAKAVFDYVAVASKK